VKILGEFAVCKAKIIFTDVENLIPVDHTGQVDTRGGTGNQKHRSAGRHLKEDTFFHKADYQRIVNAMKVIKHDDASF